MDRIFLCSSTKDYGKFLFIKWELWSIGGGAGVEWTIFGKSFSPGYYNPVWLIFEWQRRKKIKEEPVYKDII
jgi:hypothetical protein